MVTTIINHTLYIKTIDDQTFTVASLKLYHQFEQLHRSVRGLCNASGVIISMIFTRNARRPVSHYAIETLESAEFALDSES